VRETVIEARPVRLEGRAKRITVFIDTPEQVDAFLPQLGELVTEGLVVVDEVEVYDHAGRPGGSVGGAPER